MDFSDLSAEQKDKVGNCHTPEEVLALAKEEGYELSDAELDQISGGAWMYWECPRCGGRMGLDHMEARCIDCGYCPRD